MDIAVYVICLACGLFFTLIGLKDDRLAFIGLVFNVVVVSDVFVNGLTEVIGYASGVPVTRSFGVDTVILIPMFYCVILLFGIIVRWRSR